MQTNHISIIDEHPLPTTVEDAEKFQEENPMFDRNDEVLHPDELRDHYLNVIAENHEWRVFRIGIYGLEAKVYIWNHELGFGLRVADAEGIEFDSLAEVLTIAHHDGQR